ncbi:hypothetical protein VMCG_06570 [Cytospora schulzeri]|uniref:Acyl-coenzyme A diphosphatase SCS3 n=1 Tax=Cytospora schulzeri TaxID=448051 RepID=A0A423W730_9PEZI|nr:hypothetical protein VMCG_06570 [Valsa malicola]
MDDSPARNTRARAKKMANGASPSPSPTTTTFDEVTPELFRTTTTNNTTPRNPPFLPTPIEAVLLAAYPILLTFGTLFSVLDPTVRNAAYDPAQQAHVQDAALSPSYFARKSNVFNVFFVKRGWAWITLAFFAFILTHPAFYNNARARLRGMIRWALVTTWWVLVTQWCFGPAIIDRSFRFTGGRCEVAGARIEGGEADGKDFVTGMACKAAGGRWSGGHDISGHVFLLVLGSYFLLQEVGWAYLNHWQRQAGGGGGGSPVAVRDDRSVVMHDGAVKSAAVESERYIEAVEGRVVTAWEALGLGGKVAGAVVAMSWWMILMTAIYFHTWIEKLTGLLVALMGLPYSTKLPELVKSRFSNAKANGDINYYPTKVAILKPDSIPFQLRFSPSLANKPKLPAPPPPPAATEHGTETKKKPFDPFEKPLMSTIVDSVGDDHQLILNKFAVVPEHFLLVTNRFEPQTGLLEAGDLMATYNCIRAYEKEGREVFVFFNSGPHSGASQPHRHLQLLPVERMREGLEEIEDGGDGGWGLLADRLAASAGKDEGSGSLLPFVTFSERLTDDMTFRGLRSAYLRLYRRACRAVGGDATPQKGKGAGASLDEESECESVGEDEEEVAKISYNLAMTRDAMVICPRLAEGDVIRDKDGKEVGRLALNGTVLAGTALVKSQAEWDALKEDGGKQLWEILGKIGVRAEHDTSDDA